MNRSSWSARRFVSGLCLAAASVGVVGVVPGIAQSVATGPRVANSVKVGSGLYELALAEAAGTVFVVSTGSNDVKLYGLDAKTLAPKGTPIDTSAAPAYGLAVNNKTQTLYTSNTRVGSVSAIDVKTGKVLNTIKVEADPRAHTFRVLVDEDANMTYVSVAQNPGKVWAIDGKTNTLSAEIEAGTRTTGLALDKAANRLYAASLGTNEIVVIDLATKKVTAKYPSGGTGTTQLAFDPKTRRLFASNQQSGDLSVLDMATGAVLKTVKTGAGALGVGFNTKTNQIYVANRQGGTVTVIDATSYAVVADLKAGSMPNTVIVDQQTGNVYVTNKARRAGRGDAAAAPAPDEGGDTVTMITP